MSNEFVDVIVEANDEAVAMMQNGDHGHALASIQRALEALKQSVTISFPRGLPDIACRHSVTRTSSSEDEGAEDEEGRESRNVIVSIALGDYGLAESQSATPANLFSIYKHAFVLKFRPNTVTRTSQQETAHFTMITSVLVYNMALLCHRRGLVAEHNSSQSLTRAIQLYRNTVATNLLTHQDDFEELHTIELASWNNIGHIYSHLAAHENAMGCRAHIYQVLFANPATSFIRGGYYVTRPILCEFSDRIINFLIYL
jgi:hypothetical protein